MKITQNASPSNYANLDAKRNEQADAPAASQPPPKRQKPAITRQTRDAGPSDPDRRNAIVAREAGKPGSQVDFAMSTFNGRNLSGFFQPGGVETIAAVLFQERIKKVMLLTGFSVDKGLPETDGPPGTATLGHALQLLGKTVVYVTDSANHPLMTAAAGVLNPYAPEFGKFEKFDVDHGPDARAHANALLNKYQPDAVVAIELPARSEDGVRRNMRGLNINDFNPPLDEIVLAANASGKIITSGVGDGGNEAGMAGLGKIPLAHNGEPMASMVPVQYPVTSWNSNLGAQAIAAELAGLAGNLNILPTDQQQAELILATLKAGAVDGVTRGKVAGEAVVAANGVKNYTGVDGFAPSMHQSMLDLLKSIMQSTHVESIRRPIVPPTDGRPFLIGAFDSSNGGLVAAKNLANFIRSTSPHTARFVVVTDHGNAPYGTKSPEQLIKLVGEGLRATQTIGVDVIAMACNTACTAFPDAKKGLDTPVLDLIDVTSTKIVELGGARPAMFSTPATAKDARYPDEVAEKSKGALTLTPIGAEKWAPLINQLDHDSTDPVVKEKVRAAVLEYVEKVPVDATSVWLCCTHYPALKPQIEQAMRDTGRGHIKVVDPMEHQAQAIIGMLYVRGPAIDRSSRRTDLAPVVVTTGFTVGNIDHQVPKSAKGMLELPAEPRVIYTKFGKEFDIGPARLEIKDELFEKPPAPLRRSPRLNIPVAHA